MNSKMVNKKSTGGGAYQKNSRYKAIQYFGKIIISGFLAFLILNLFLLFYYNVPVYDKKYGKTINKTTESKYEPLENYTKGIEGYGRGRVNNDGYINVQDYITDMPINILIMGSSHMEATQINMYDSTASLLNKRFSDKEVYNIGTSAHNFLVNVKNLKNALDKYKPTDYLIIETVNVNFSSDDLISIININNETTNKGITSNESFLSKIRENQIFRVIYKYSPFLKLTFHLLNEIKICDDDVIDASNQSITPFDSKNTEKILNTIRDNTLNTNLKVIIVYHPNTTLDSNGSLILSSEKENVEEFSKLCQDNGIYFLDMSNRFKEEYRKKYILPYGFNNTSVGSGHLNKYGHEMIADELYKLIKEVE